MKTGTIAIALIAAAAACGCATKPRTEPVVSTVCADFGALPETETTYARKKSAQYLSERGFKLVDSGCEAKAKFALMGQFQAEVISGLLMRSSGYWSLEGIVSVSRGDKVDLDDQSINLRRYSTKQELLDALAWSVVGPVTWLYQPPPEPAKAAVPAASK